MSYEKVRVVKIEEVVSRESGEVKNYVVMERLVPMRVSARDPELRRAYEALKGKVVMAPIVQDEYNGRKFWRFESDGMPMTGATS